MRQLTWRGPWVASSAEPLVDEAHNTRELRSVENRAQRTAEPGRRAGPDALYVENLDAFAEGLHHGVDLLDFLVVTVINGAVGPLEELQQVGIAAQPIRGRGRTNHRTNHSTLVSTRPVEATGMGL